jgi:hypothetical protein
LREGTFGDSAKVTLELLEVGTKLLALELVLHCSRNETR